MAGIMIIRMSAPARAARYVGGEKIAVDLSVAPRHICMRAPQPESRSASFAVAKKVDYESDVIFHGAISGFRVAAADGFIDRPVLF